MIKEDYKNFQTFIQNYFLDLRKGFSLAYIDKRIKINNGYQNVNLAFFQIFLRAFIVVKIKKGKLLPEDLRKTLVLVENFDKNFREKDENPTIGLIIAFTNKYLKVKYVFPDSFFEGHEEKYLEILLSEREIEKGIGRFFSKPKSEDDLFNGIAEIINNFNLQMKEYIPEIEDNINFLINSGSTDIKEIELILDTLMDLSMVLDVKYLFDRLVDYYHGVNADNSAYYKKSYMNLLKENEENF